MAEGDSGRANTQPTQSPCVSICKLDPQGKFCIGCGRTLAQIAAAGANAGR
jgi:predicted Fe-S protein YdhL (DUF1289 family)